MINVWKCSFCFTTNKDKAKVAAHELICSFNPANKQCSSCKHQTIEQWPGEILYNCNVNVSYEDRLDIEDGDLVCDKWVSRRD